MRLQARFSSLNKTTFSHLLQMSEATTLPLSDSESSVNAASAPFLTRFLIKWVNLENRVITHLFPGHTRVTTPHCTRCGVPGRARSGRSPTETRCWGGPGCRVETWEPGRTRRKRRTVWAMESQRRTCRRKSRSWRKDRGTGAPEGCWEMNPRCWWSESRSLPPIRCCLPHTGHRQNTPTPLQMMEEEEILGTRRNRNIFRAEKHDVHVMKVGRSAFPNWSTWAHGERLGGYFQPHVFP